MPIRHLAAAERIASPWKNGGGVTREIAIGPPGANLGAFDWRISMAEVDVAGPFSCFPNIDRVLTVISGELGLDIAGGAPVTLGPTSAPFAFSGDAACHGAPRTGPVVDLNVMVRRGLVQADVRRVDDLSSHHCSGAVLLVLALEPGALAGIEMAPFDALIADGGETLTPAGAFHRIAVDLSCR